METNLCVAGFGGQGVMTLGKFLASATCDSTDKNVTFFPSYGAEQNGLLASLNSLTKLPYEWALDGISNTQTMNPEALGANEEERVNNLVNIMDGYFDQGAHHLNVNVFGKELLLDAMEHPEKPEYANFTIRVSGYAVKFIDLTREQQMDVISRTFHDRM